MNLEILPNELFLKLFDYLTILDVFQAFENLNFRFQSLILIYCRDIRLNFQGISKTNFDIICRKYLPIFAKQIRSLQLANDDDTPQQIPLFISYGFHLQNFTYLQTLSLSHIHSSYLLDKLLTECSHLSFLTNLSIINCHVSINQSTAEHLYNQIWSLPNLIQCYFDIHSPNRNHFPTPTIVSKSMKSLSIPNISCYSNPLILLLQSTPNLEYLSITYIDYIDQYNMPLPVLSVTRLKLSFDCSLNILKYLLQSLPNLCHLTLDTCNLYMNGYQWEELITTYLPHLETFRFKMRFSPTLDTEKEVQMNEILNSFRTKFWIEEHQWFVRCHWYASNEQYRLDFIDLFTLPYMFKEFLSYTGCILAKSTCASDDCFWSYDQVNQLCYGSSHFTSSIMSRLRFSNIEHLSLSLPYNEQFLLVIPKLDRLVSLFVSINNHKDTSSIPSQLQLLLDRAKCLTTLSFGSWGSTSLGMLFTNIVNRTIRKLNFQGYICGKNWRCFDEKQCLDLIHSPLGVQCETLLIKVKNRICIYNLVKEMQRLQALNVRCENDRWTQENSLSSSARDDLIEWLKECVPRSCVITRDTYRIGDIRLWIR
ncbi:unnamed protein product [Adineta ricciae]|uniref:F-box domain-containing protein n=1 Tax=Adineta ricciae TaxID=249248 RepID=A0A815ZC92_ADIRI|nr:unnamed protein product [Adineta ricciae]